MRPLMVALNGIPYTLLVSAFAVGVWTSAPRKRAGRITGAMLLGYAAFGMAGGWFPDEATRGPGGGRGDAAQRHAHPCDGW